MRNDREDQPSSYASWHASPAETSDVLNPSTDENMVIPQSSCNNSTPQKTESGPDLASSQQLSAGSWGWGLLSFNGTSLYSSVKRDLEELHHQATELASGTVSSVARILQSNVLIDDARKAAEFVRDGVDSVVRSIDESLQISHDQVFGSGNENDGDDAVAAGLTRENLKAILNDSNTFTMEPRGSEADEFDKWATEQFNFDAAQPRIERLLMENDHVAKLYEDFVVSDKLLTHNEFWLRYFFRVRQACLERQRQLTQQTLTRRSKHSPVRSGVGQAAGTDDDGAVMVMQPGSITGDTIIGHPLPATQRPEFSESRPSTTTTATAISSDAMRFLHMVVDEECAAVRKTGENDDVYSFTSTDSFSLVDQDVERDQRSGAKDILTTSNATTTGIIKQSPERTSRNSRADDEDGWEKAV